MTTPAAAGWYRQQTKAIGTITPSGNIVVERVTRRSWPISRGRRAFLAHPGVRFERCLQGRLRLGRHARAARTLVACPADVISWNGSKGGEHRLRCRHGVVRAHHQGDRERGHDLDPRARGACCARAARAISASCRPQRSLSGQGDRSVRAAGYPCVAEAHAGFTDNFSYCRCRTRTSSRWSAAAAAKPDAIVTFCTNFPGRAPGGGAGGETGIPIYDTVSAGVWDALRRAGVATGRGARWGSLFAG